MTRSQRAHLKTWAYSWHRGLVERCRPYRTTHLPVLRAVARHMAGAYGPRWYVQPAARELAVGTLRYFGVLV